MASLSQFKAAFEILIEHHLPGDGCVDQCHAVGFRVNASGGSTATASSRPIRKLLLGGSNNDSKGSLHG